MLIIYYGILMRPLRQEYLGAEAKDEVHLI